MAEPKIRFKQDNGRDYPEWKEDALGNLGSFIKGASLSKADISKTGNPFILYGELYTTYGEVAYTIVRKTEAVVDKKYYSIVGDVIIPTSGESPEEISTATCVMVPNVILAGDLNIYRTNVIDGRIMSYLLNHQINNKIAAIAQGKSVVHVQAKNLEKLTVCYPYDEEEQQKIANFLSDVDEVIAKSEAEVAALEKQKKGVMQKIFSQEVRFKKDDGSDYPDWKTKILTEIFDTRNGYTPSKNNSDFWSNGTIPWYRMEDIRENGRILFDAVQHVSKAAKKGAGWFPPKTIIFATSATVGEHAILMTESLSNQRFTAIIPKSEYKSQLDSMFIYYIGFEIDKYCMEHQTLGTMPAVDMNAFKAYEFPIPCLEEQQKIANFLSSFDETINLAKQELDKWKLLKKGLLHQMFV